MRRMQILNMNFHIVIESEPPPYPHLGLTFFSFILPSSGGWESTEGDQTWWAERVWLRRGRAAKSTQSVCTGNERKQRHEGRQSVQVCFYLGAKCLHDFTNVLQDWAGGKKNELNNGNNERYRQVWFCGSVCKKDICVLMQRWSELVRNPQQRCNIY